MVARGLIAAAARLSRLPHHEALDVAVIMNARGVMEMVVASIALRAGLVDAKLFSALLVMGVVTTLLTPVILKRWMASPSCGRDGQPRRKFVGLFGQS